MDGFAATLNEEDEQIEVPGDERLLLPVADEHAAARGQDEFVETISRHSFKSHGHRNTIGASQSDTTPQAEGGRPCPNVLPRAASAGVTSCLMRWPWGAQRRRRE